MTHPEQTTNPEASIPPLLTVSTPAGARGDDEPSIPDKRSKSLESDTIAPVPPGIGGQELDSFPSGSNRFTGGSARSLGKRVQEEIEKHLQAGREIPDAQAKGWREPAPGYELIEPLQAGSFGSVWKACKPDTPGHYYAIKFFPRRSNINHADETHHLKTLRNEHGFIQLIDISSANTTEWPYYVMNFVTGSLKDRLNDNPAPLPVKEAVHLFTRLTEAMAYAHQREPGLVHCDLKPGNVLMNDQNQPLITDFGQSKLVDDPTGALGTEGYMPPEQADLGNDQPDKRWDVYALGAIGYAMLTHKHHPPRWERVRQELSSAPQARKPETHLKRYREQLYKTPVDWSLLPREVDHEFVRILDRCLTTDTSRRYQDAGQVCEALRQRKHRLLRRPVVRWGLVGTALVTIAAVVFGIQIHQNTVEESRTSLKREIAAGQKALAQVAAEALEARLRERVQFVRAVGNTEASRPARLALREAIDKYRKHRQLPPPFIWNDQDRAAVTAWGEAITRQGAAQGLFLTRGANILINADHRAYSFVYHERDNAQQPWRLRSPWRDNTTVRATGMNYAFRDYFNGVAEFAPSTTASEGMGGPDNDDRRPPVEQTHISTVYLSQSREPITNHKRWFVEVVEPLRNPDPPHEVVGVVACSIDVRRELANWLRESTDARASNALGSNIWVIDGRGKLVLRDQIDQIVGDDATIPEYGSLLTRYPPDPAAEPALRELREFDDPYQPDPRQPPKRLFGVVQAFDPLQPVTRTRDAVPAPGGADADQRAGAAQPWHVIVTRDAHEALKPIEEMSDKLIRHAHLPIAVFLGVLGLFWLAGLLAVRKLVSSD